MPLEGGVSISYFLRIALSAPKGQAASSKRVCTNNVVTYIIVFKLFSDFDCFQDFRDPIFLGFVFNTLFPNRLETTLPIVCVTSNSKVASDQNFTICGEIRDSSDHARDTPELKTTSFFVVETTELACRLYFGRGKGGFLS